MKVLRLIKFTNIIQVMVYVLKNLTGKYSVLYTPL